MKKDNIIINNKKDLDAFYESIYLLTQPEVMQSIKEGEKEDIKTTKAYNPKQSW